MTPHGPSGWDRGSTAAATRSSCSVKSWIRRRTSSSGSRTRVSTARPTTFVATTPGWAGSTNRASSPSDSAGSTCASASRAVTEFLDWPYDVEQPIAPAIKRVEHGPRRRGRPAEPSRRTARRPAGDGRRAGCTRPRDDRAATTARPAAGSKGRHRGECPGGRLRRRTHRRTDHRGRGPVAGPRCRTGLDAPISRSWASWSPRASSSRAPERPVRQADSAASSLARPSVAW